MRIHDLNVVADLHAPNPTAPDPYATVECDGTSDGMNSKLTTLIDTDSLLQDAENLANQVLTWWEGIWPILHLSLSFATNLNGYAIIHFSIDLLGDLDVEETDFSSPIFDQMTATQRDCWVQQVGYDAKVNGDIENSFRDATTGVMFIIKQCCSLVASAFSVGGIVAVAAVLEIAIASWLIWLFTLMGAYETNLVSGNFIIGILSAWLDSFIGPTGLIVSTFLKSAIYYYIISEVYSSVKTLDDFKSWLIWTIIGVVTQFFMFIYTYYIFIVMLEVSASSYMEGVST